MNNNDLVMQIYCNEQCHDFDARNAQNEAEEKQAHRVAWFLQDFDRMEEVDAFPDIGAVPNFRNLTKII